MWVIQVSEKSQAKKVADKRQVEQGTASLPKKDKSKKNTSLRLDKQTLKALKIRAIEQDTSIQKLIEKLIKDYLK